MIKTLISANLIWLAILSMVFAILGAFYYIRIIKTMYFDQPSDATALSYPKDMLAAISVNGLALLALGIFPTALLHLCQLAF